VYYSIALPSGTTTLNATTCVSGVDWMLQPQGYLM
jgi:hypothetical protein